MARNASRTEHQAVVVGGGPTGMMLAGELKLAGVDVAVAERRAGQDLLGHRAGGLHARTIEIFDQRGIAGRFLAQGQKAQVAGFASVPLDIGDFPTRHPYGLALWQRHIEAILAAWIAELSVPVMRGTAVAGLDQDAAGVTATLADGGTLRGQYLVGCDGGRSVVRKAAGIAFTGWDATVSNLIAEAALTEEAPWGIRHDAIGTHGLSQLEGGRVRVMITERDVGNADEPTLADLSAGLIAHFGTDFGVHSPSYVSRFTDAARQAETYRAGRVLLAGDAAHVHYPVGGQGLNLGVADAVNLGWKLAQVVSGISGEALLDTYYAERHPIAARVLTDTLAQVALGRPDPRSKAARETVAELLAMEEPRRRVAARMSGLGLRYDLGGGHPLVGRRMPDLDLMTPTGPTTVYALLHAARPLFIDFGAPGGFDVSAWGDRVQVVTASCDGPWDLPALGPVEAPVAVLVRPDGHVAWASRGEPSGLSEALARWFGAPAVPGRPVA